MHHHYPSLSIYGRFVTQEDPDGKKYSFRPSDIVPVIVMDMRLKLKTAIRRNSAFMTRLHKPDNDDFCAPKIKTYELPELLQLYIKVAVPHFRTLIVHQVFYMDVKFNLFKVTILLWIEFLATSFLHPL